MPFIDYTDPAQFTWRESATRALGIPLHPQGELNLFDFYIESSSMSIQRDRLLGIHTQMLVIVLMTITFGYALFLSARMTILHPRVLFAWCCLVASLAGTLVAIVSIVALLGLAFNCRITVWAIAVGMSVAQVCGSLIMLRKASLVLYQHRWITYLALPCLLPQLCFAALTFAFCFVTAEPHYGCRIYVPAFFPWVWAGCIFPLNALFSAVFCHVALQQYRTIGSEAWRRLAHDGIQALCLVCLCNLLCGLLVASDVGGVNSDAFYTIDW
ncbi:hypothetical protein SYNPS1DRAFT_23182 [Syncephalis pseudoplumigaleata]|uniref:Uncharacterized protein n=1 Tax=Syncephalis pseudoplumigaleata TaxID=1712513 RepID=A0A4V1J1E3_9FUNG|nr:hypothetical protein SYNPS1DRAFT_23182 [Syncephalis pseudoplumigaleata]|eukprot:RKP24759.1 hypothetical protein SYNPS1DRAFT_23182 [Syncephalis pseudoplumigaleata]